MIDRSLLPLDVLLSRDKIDVAILFLILSYFCSFLLHAFIFPSFLITFFLEKNRKLFLVIRHHDMIHETNKLGKVGCVLVYRKKYCVKKIPENENPKNNNNNHNDVRIGG